MGRRRYKFLGFWEQLDSPSPHSMLGECFRITDLKQILQGFYADILLTRTFPKLGFLRAFCACVLRR